MTRSYFDKSENWNSFKNHSEKFLTKMQTVSDFYNTVISRSNNHKNEINNGIKADNYEWHSKVYFNEYIKNYKSNIDKKSYINNLILTDEKFQFIYNEFVELIKIAVNLNVNIPPPMFYDYCASVSSLKAVRMTLVEIKKINNQS